MVDIPIHTLPNNYYKVTLSCSGKSISVTYDPLTTVYYSTDLDIMNTYRGLFEQIKGLLFLKNNIKVPSIAFSVREIKNSSGINTANVEVRKNVLE